MSDTGPIEPRTRRDSPAAIDPLPVGGSAGSFARDLPLHVRKEAGRTVPNVYRLDR